MQESIRVLVVDDEEPLRRLLKKELTRKGFSVEVAADGRAAVEILKENTFDILLLDIIMPGIDGISLMKKLQSDPASPAIIVLTGRATVETAVEAMKHGAYDYLTKPYKLDELVIVINRAYEYGKLSMKSRLFQQELVRKDTPAEFLCTSRQMKDILALIKKIAPTDSPVFIQGESGTGKEIVANTIWRMSKRNSFPFIALNCASLSENLIESEIFGHEKGAFTNAYQTKNGIVEVADKGTLFLDEIGEMPLGPQAKLLRFLDSGEFRRVGSNKALVVNVRLITATNKKLAELVKKGEFREDLYYRLNVINIQVPPLRERPDDIPELAVHFLKKYSREMSKQIKEFTPRAIETLSTYAWPGNVRELENVIERAVILSDAESIDFEDLSMPAQPPKELSANPSLEEIEKDYILRVLREANSNQSKASHILGIDRKTLYLKLKKYGIG
ncbi:MAG TPA: sigma-54 dependent transcriptional regulator [Candidatus Sulfobium mesophilum]|nr:sigma-54 dependent transcriptional regulator [Candidatus Sulfobium mesophilum]